MKKRKQEIVEPIEELVETVNPVVESDEYYLLKIGETLEEVAKKFNIDSKKLRELNGGELFGGNQIKLK